MPKIVGIQSLADQTPTKSKLKGKKPLSIPLTDKKISAPQLLSNPNFKMYYFKNFFTHKTKTNLKFYKIINNQFT